MMSLTFGLFIHVSDSGPHGPLVKIKYIWSTPPVTGFMALLCHYLLKAGISFDEESVHWTVS